MAAPHRGQGPRGMSSQPFQSIVLWNGHHLLSSFVLLSQINFYWFIISLRFYDFIITRIFITYLFIHFLHSNTLKSCMLWENLEFCAREWFGHLKSDPRPSPNRMMFRREMAIIARVHENMKSMLEWITSNKIHSFTASVSVWAVWFRCVELIVLFTCCRWSIIMFAD